MLQIEFWKDYNDYDCYCPRILKIYHYECFVDLCNDLRYGDLLKLWRKSDRLSIRKDKDERRKQNKIKQSSNKDAETIY